MKSWIFWWVHQCHCEKQGFLPWMVAKSCATLDGRKLVNNGVNHLSTGAGFRNHPQYVSITGQSCWKDHGLLTSQCLAVTQRRSLWQTACKQIGVFYKWGYRPIILKYIDYFIRTPQTPQFIYYFFPSPRPHKTDPTCGEVKINDTLW